MSNCKAFDIGSCCVLFNFFLFFNNDVLALFKGKSDLSKFQRVFGFLSLTSGILRVNHGMIIAKKKERKLVSNDLNHSKPGKS